MGRGDGFHRSISMAHYFDWLCDIVEINQENRSYIYLAHALHDKYFYWSVPNDDNRISDAMLLRDEYFNGRIPNNPCSVFELLIGIAVRIEEMMCEPEKGDRTAEWFWMMMSNLNIDFYNDETYLILMGEQNIDAIVTKLLDRTYTRNGRGGLFPLTKAKKDQRKVEIWYQMCTYLVDNYTFDD